VIYDKVVAFNKKVTTITDHFQLAEFVCRCGSCQIQRLDILLPLMLEDLRKAIGDRALNITSGYRCPLWNKQQGGANDSAHLRGQAVDFYVKGMEPLTVAKVAYKVGFRRIGVADGFIHLDVKDLPEEKEYQFWVYGRVDLEKVKREILNASDKK
jgi:uncharacterized protein YcbK (DUF882 family)